MNDQTERERLEDVLDAYVASEAGPNSASLAEWVRRYPRYERELRARSACPLRRARYRPPLHSTSRRTHVPRDSAAPETAVPPSSRPR